MLGGVWLKMLHDQWRMLAVWTVLTGLLAGFYLSLYPSIGAVEEMRSLLEAMPPELRAMFSAEGADTEHAGGVPEHRALPVRDAPRRHGGHADQRRRRHGRRGGARDARAPAREPGPRAGASSSRSAVGTASSRRSSAPASGSPWPSPRSSATSTSPSGGSPPRSPASGFLGMRDWWRRLPGRRADREPVAQPSASGSRRDRRVLRERLAPLSDVLEPWRPFSPTTTTSAMTRSPTGSTRYMRACSRHSAWCSSSPQPSPSSAATCARSADSMCAGGERQSRRQSDSVLLPDATVADG